MLRNKSLGASVAWYLLFFSLSLYMVSLVDVNHVLRDSFHEGEYLGVLWHIESYYHGNSTFPLVIHGGMDFIPALLAKFLYGPDQLVVGTRVINAVIVALTWSFFLALFRKIILAGMASSWWLVLPITFLWLVAIRLDDAVSLHQAFLNPRDIFLVALAYFVLSFECAEDKGGQLTNLVLAAISCSISLFWSYDRGVVALGFFLMFLIGLFFRRRLLDAALTLFTFTIFIIITDLSHLMGTLSEVLSNVIYWSKHSTDWRLPYTIIRVGYAAPITLLVLFSIYVFLPVLKQSSSSIQKIKWYWLALLVLQLLSLSLALKRPDSAHISWSIWPALLFFFYSAVQLLGDKCIIKIRWVKPLNLPVCVFFYAAAMLVCIVFYFFIPSNNTLSFIKNLLRPDQNMKVVSEDKVAVATNFLESNPHCFFGWTNDGEMAMLVGKPYCTKITYATYASRDSDNDLLIDLRMSNPNAILLGPGNYPTNIVSNSMQTRLPKVSQFIMDNYPNEQVIGVYVIRKK